MRSTVFSSHRSNPAELTTANPELAALPCLSQVDGIAREMAQHGIERVLLTPCKAGIAICDRRYLCDDTVTNELLHHVQRYPRQFAALGGFNPYDLEDSVARLESTLRRGLGGLFVDSRALGLSLLDRRMYPAFAKCSERHRPLMIAIGPGRTPADRTIFADIQVVAGEFPDLCIVVACDHWPSVSQLRKACESRDNLNFALDGNLPSGELAEAIVFLTSASSAGRCLWGSNGEAWTTALARVTALHLPAETQRRYLWTNAARVFQLDDSVEARPFELKSVRTAE